MADPTSLGDAAKDALATVSDQGKLPGTNLAKVTFLGMGWEPAEVPPLRDEVEFTVRGTVVFDGEQVMADGEIRPIAKVKVSGVRRVPAGTFDKLKQEDRP